MSQPTRCSSNACVDITTAGDLFLIRSTRRPDAEPVPFDGDEIVKFVDEVKAGKWDATYAQAKTKADALV